MVSDELTHAVQNRVPNQPAANEAAYMKVTSPETLYCQKDPVTAREPSILFSSHVDRKTHTRPCG